MSRREVLAVFPMISAISGAIVAGIKRRDIDLDDEAKTKNARFSGITIISKRIEYVSNFNTDLPAELTSSSTFLIQRI